MTQYQVTVDGDVVQPVLQRDDGLAQLVSAVLDQILEAQVTEQLQAERFERIHELATQGMSKSAIARALGHPSAHRAEVPRAGHPT